MMQLLECDLTESLEYSHEVPDARAALNAAGIHTRRRIFVVDDYPGLAEAAKFVLEGEGFEVSAFCERELALRAFVDTTPRPELLITDYLGGSMSGLGLIKICKAIHPRLKTLLVSGLDCRTLSPRELLLLDGALAKPYSAAELMEQVHRLCNGSAWPGAFSGSSLTTRKTKKSAHARTYPA